MIKFKILRGRKPLFYAINFRWSGFVIPSFELRICDPLKSFY